jgi:hypothetical protein
MESRPHDAHSLFGRPLTNPTRYAKVCENK